MGKGKIITKTKNYSKRLKIWLDDERPMPKGFNYHCKSASEAICLLREYNVDLISLDHDLGDNPFTWSEVYSQFKPTGCGYDVAKAIEKGAYAGNIKKVKWRIHSANPVGSENMKKALENADKFWDEGRKNASNSKDKGSETSRKNVDLS